MNKFIVTILAAGTFTTLSAQTLDRSIRPKAGPAPVLQMGEAKSFVSTNGIKVYVVENHKLPVVNYSIDFDIHPEMQGDMAGFQDMMGDLLTAGTKTKTKDEFNETLDALGASLSIGSDGIFMQSLKKNSDKLLALATEVLTAPRWSQEELDKLKKQAKSGLQTEMDDPEAMSRNITSVLNFGKNHPYGELTTEKSVENISLERCKIYFETYFRPNVAYMAIVGDITLAEAKAQVEKHFSKWQKKVVPRATYPTPKPGNGAAVAVVNKGGAVQSVIDITYPINMKPGDPDEIKLKVANGILGGGSTGRLFQNLRETHAWTYGSYSSFRTDELPYAGSFSVTSNSTTAASDSSVAEMLKEMNRLRTEIVPNEDLEGYKTYMAGTFALGLEDPRTLARYAINERKYNMPAGYYKNYLKNVEKVTAQDVMTVAKKYITPGVAHITVAGDKKQVADKLRQFGPVTIYDRFGNVEKEEAPKALPANLTAEDVVKKYVTVSGGEANWKKVTDLTMMMTTEMQGTPININSVRKAPNKVMVDVNAGGQTVQKTVFDGEKGYVVMMGQQKDMEADKIAEMKTESIYGDLQYLSSGYQVKLLGIEKAGEEDAYQVEVTSPTGKKSTHYYSVGTGFKVKSEEVNKTPRGEVTQTSFFSDYRDTPFGLKFPYAVKRVAGPQVFDMKVQTIEFNGNISDDMFK
jgi:zinc protease